MAGLGFLCGSAEKNLPAVQKMQETWVWPLGQVDPLEEGMQPTSVFMPGESHGQRSLEGYSPQGCKSQTQFSNYTTTTISFLGFASYLDHTEHWV